MTPKKVLIIHIVVFIGFLVFSLSSPFIAMRYAAFFSGYFFPFAIIVMPIILIAWHFFGGCPFTVWENRLRERTQSGSSYQNSCIQYYAFQWFGIRIPLKLIQPALVALLVLPITVGLL
ncbi:MAG: DUF2784 family protein [bacterium]|nr:DUF2784 family protein [bacterium]